MRKLPDLLTPTSVGRMSDDKLMELAAESEESQIQRQQLQEEVAVLEKGLTQCRRLRPRNPTGRQTSRAVQV